MSFYIREANPGDAEQLIAYVQRLADEPNIFIVLSPGEFDYTVEQEQQILKDIAASDNSIYLVAEVGGQIIGMLNCKGGTRKTTRHTVTISMSVDNRWRDQGVGSALMERAIQWARQAEIVTRLELYVFARNLAAIHLYKKYGFVVEGRLRKAMKREGEYHDDLIMALLL